MGVQAMTAGGQEGHEGVTWCLWFRETQPPANISASASSHHANADKLTLLLGRMLTFAWLMRIAAHLIVTVSRFTVFTPR